MLGLSAVQSPSVIQACSAIQACSGITVIPVVEEDEEVVAFTNTYSLDFDGIDDYAAIADSDDLSFGNGSTDSAFSGMAWVKMDDATNFRIFSKTQDTNNREYLFNFDANDKLTIVLYDLDLDNKLKVRYDTASTALEGGWHHVAFTYDGSGLWTGITLYIDGSAVTPYNTSTGTYVAMHNTTGSLDIGRWNLSGYANGKIDEVVIIPSELSAAQITAIYNSGVPVDLTSYSPIGWWRFEEGSGTSIADLSGNGHTATLTNGPTFSTDVPVYVFNRYSVDFDGTDDYAAINDNFLTSYGSDTQGTVSAWVYCEDVSAANFPIFSLHNNNITKYLRFMHYEGRLWAGLWDGSWDWILDTDTSELSINTWHHVALTHNGTTPILYVDGVAPAQAFTLSNNITAWFNSVAVTKAEIGAFSKASQWFDGKIDELAYFSGTALSAAQIAAIYNSGVPTDLSSYSPVGYWRMGDNDGGTGTTITDQGSGGNDATLTNGPTFSTDVPGVTPFTNTYSVDFDNSDDYIDLTAFNPSTQIGSGDITISVWVKLDSIAGYDTVASLTYYNASAEKSIKIQFLPGLGFRVQFANSGAFTNIYSTATIAANTWYHVIATRTGTTGNIWVNNADNGTNTHSNIGTDLSGATWHALGLYHAAATPDMGGLIHDYAIFDRVISSDERAELYNNGVSIDAREVTGADPVAYYPLNEGTSTVATDLISANNGTLTNGPTWSTDVPT